MDDGDKKCYNTSNLFPNLHHYHMSPLVHLQLLGCSRAKEEEGSRSTLHSEFTTLHHACSLGLDPFARSGTLISAWMFSER